jgi:hypothetical protein
MDKRNRLIVALADLVDFDFDTERYRLAGSYEKALDICFEQLIESLNHNNSMTYDVAIATVINLKSEDDIRHEIKKFIKRVYKGTFVEFFDNFLKINKIYPCLVEEKLKILDNMTKYQSDITDELKKINHSAEILYTWGMKYKLNKEPEFLVYLTQLETLSDMGFKLFFVILKSVFKEDATIDNKIFENFFKKHINT